MGAVGLILLAWGLGVRGLGADAIWYDEDWTLRLWEQGATAR